MLRQLYPRKREAQALDIVYSSSSRRQLWQRQPHRKFPLSGDVHRATATFDGGAETSPPSGQCQLKSADVYRAMHEHQFYVRQDRF